MTMDELVTNAVRIGTASLAAEISDLRRASAAQSEELSRLRQTIDLRLPAEPWPTRAEAAKQLMVCVDTVDRAVRAGTLRARKIGRSVRIDPQCLRPIGDDEVESLARAALRPVAGRGGGR